jgi:hypothetical protein
MWADTFPWAESSLCLLKVRDRNRRNVYKNQKVERTQIGTTTEEGELRIQEK